MPAFCQRRPTADYSPETHLPSLSRWLIRTALAYLLLAFIVGAILPVLPGAVLFWPTYVHLLVLGWLTQLIFGVAYWMFPRRHSKQSPHQEGLGWSTYWLLNAGLVVRVLGEGGRAAGQKTDLLLVAAAVLQLLAGWGFVLVIWPRVRGR